jgi:hypothetical protein
VVVVQLEPVVLVLLHLVQTQPVAETVEHLEPMVAVVVLVAVVVVQVALLRVVLVTRAVILQ